MVTSRLSNLRTSQSEKIVSDISEINKIFKKLKVKYRLKKSNITKKKLNEYNDYKHYKLIQKLNKIYKKPNSELSKKFNISLRDWK